MSTTFIGTSVRSVSARLISFTTSMLFFAIISPNTTCFPSKCGAGPVVMKNCEPFVFSPALAIERIPGPACFRAFFRFSSGNR